MNVRRSLAVGLAVVFSIGFIVVSRGEPVQGDGGSASVVFVCRNGVSMSVWSAAYFNRLAAASGLRHRATSRAALPSYDAVPLRMRVALALDGFRLDGYRPRLIDAEDRSRAERIVMILPAETNLELGASAESWDGFPPMRERYFEARAALSRRVEDLVDRLANAATDEGGASRSVARRYAMTAIPSSSTSASSWKSAVTPKSAIVG